jgi:hypothetical protein
MQNTNNPFYVHPGGDYSSGLAGLSQTFKDYGDIKRKEDKEQKIIDKFAKIKAGAAEAYRTGDPEKIAEFSLENPEMAQALSVSMGFKNKRTEDNYRDSLFEVYQNPTPENIDKIVQARQKLLQEQGVTPENSTHTDSFVKKYNEDPEGVKKLIATELAFRYPEKWKAMKEATGAAIEPKDRYKVVGDRLVDLMPEDGKPKVVVDSMKKETPETLLSKGLVVVGDKIVNVKDPSKITTAYDASPGEKPLTKLGELKQEFKNRKIDPEEYKVLKEQIINPQAKTKTELTAAALKGDLEAKNILEEMAKSDVEMARLKGAAAAKGKLEGLYSVMDLDATAEAVYQGRDILSNVRNTFGVPLQEVVRAKVLAMDPNFNFNQPEAIKKSLNSSLMQQQKNRGMMGSFVKNINLQVDKLEEMSNDIISRVGVRALDVPRRLLVTKYIGSGHENVFTAYMKEVSAEIQKLSQGSTASVAQLPEANRGEWEAIHDPNLSIRELKKVLEGTREMANMRLSSVDREITDTIGRLEDVRATPTTPPSGQYAPPAALEYLKKNPEFKQQFIDKYGYTPEGA